MIATHRVKNSKGRTVGFIADGDYFKYFNTLNNIQFMSNLKADKDGVIRADRKLKEIKVKDVNHQTYTQACSKDPLVRDIQEDLDKWKEHWNHKVLCLSGARQIGKTTELLKFAYKNYEQIIYVNLAEEENLKSFVDLVLHNDNKFGLMNYCMKLRLEEFDNTSDTILIIDEIQQSSEVYNSIRSLQSNLNCHIVVTGSYLGRTLSKEYFKPAGNLYDIEMLPLSFTEFCRAFGQERELLALDLYGESDKANYAVLTDLYKIYRTIGGYPEVVQSYKKTHDFDTCYKVLESIINRFTEESKPYIKSDKGEQVFKSVYRYAFINIMREKKGTASKDVGIITDFVKADTKAHISRQEVNEALSWLVYSHILGSCDLYNQGNVLDLLFSRRFYFMDCGIASYIAKTTAAPNEMVDGAITENFAYTELYRLYKNNKDIKGDVPCCSVYNNYELDFMIVDKNDMKYGIEVKASNSSNPISLNKYLERNLIDKAYLAGITKGGVRDKIKAIPIYTVGCRFPYD